MRTLFLPLKGEYFDAIKSGAKTEEYRTANAFWEKRLVGRDYDEIVLTRGYPSKTDTSRRLVRKWNGFVRKTITHEFFGDDPVDVFAIDVTRGVEPE